MVPFATLLLIVHLPDPANLALLMIAVLDVWHQSDDLVDFLKTVVDFYRLVAEGFAEEEP